MPRDIVAALSHTPAVNYVGQNVSTTATLLLRVSVVRMNGTLEAVTDRGVSDVLTASSCAKPFIWKGDPDHIIATRNRGFQTLESIH